MYVQKKYIYIKKKNQRYMYLRIITIQYMWFIVMYSYIFVL